MKRYGFLLPEFEALPANLRPSDYVDMLLFLSHNKPTVRLGLNSEAAYQSMADWCTMHHFNYCISQANYMYISTSHYLANLTRIIDDATFPHEFILGILLGYPSCCARKASLVGEINLDQWEQEQYSLFDAQASLQLINPTKYLSGASLIAHIPCSTNCKKSLRIAKKTLSVISQNKASPYFNRWKQWVELDKKDMKDD